jgi:hypothetical protein
MVDGAVVVTMPHCNESTVMATAMITDADPDSADPNGDSSSVRGRRRHRQSQAESCEHGE